jgi:site-specific recombinase XerD
MTRIASIEPPKIFDAPLLLWSDSKCVLDDRTYDRVPVLVDPCGQIIESATDWLLHLTVSGRTGKLTVQQYAHELKQFWGYLSRKKCVWTMVNDRLLRIWRNELGVSIISARTINARLDVVVRFYLWAQEQGLIQDIIGATLERGKPFPIRLIRNRGSFRLSSSVRVKVTRKPRRPIPTTHEVERLYENLSRRSNHALAVRDCLISDWALQAGLRRFELISLLVTSIPSISECLDLCQEERLHYLKVVGKGGHQREVPILPELLRRTREYIDGERHDIFRSSLALIDLGALFISQKTGIKLSLEYVSRVFTAAFGNKGERKLNLHRLRARFTSKLFQALLRDEIARTGLASLRKETVLFKGAEILGHNDLKSLHYYLNIELDALEIELHKGLKNSKPE